MSNPVKGRRRRRRWVPVLVVGLAATAWFVFREAVPSPDMNLVRKALTQSRWDDVEKQLARWNEAYPEDGEAGLLLGLARLSAGRLEAGARTLEAIPEGHAAWAQAQAALGEAAIRRHDLPEAERRLRASIARNPDADPPRERLVYLLSLELRHGEAREALLRRVRAARDPRALVTLVEQVWAHDNDVRALLPEVTAALAVTPDDPFLRRARGLALLYDGDAAEALPHLEAAARALEDDPEGRFALAECLLGLGRLDGGLETLGPRPADPPGALRWHVLRGRLAEALGRPEDALADLRAAVAMAPEDRRARFQLGKLLARRGDAEAAAEHLRRASEIEARHDAIRSALAALKASRAAPTADQAEALARLCLDAGLRDEARAWADLALAADPRRVALRDATAAAVAAGPTLLAPPTPRLRAVAASGPAVAAADTPPPVRFADVTDASGVRYRYDSGASPRLFLADTIGGGVGMLDVDGDGLLDLYFVNGGPLPTDPDRPPAPNRLYRNLGGFRFEDVTERAGVGGRGFGMGCAAGDYDRDGHIDLLVTGVDATILYRNNGDGTFTDVSTSAGIRSDHWTTAAAFADLDADGDLDLVVTGYVVEDFQQPRDCRDGAGRRIHCSPRSYPAAPDHLFRNNGDGTFTDVAAEAGFEGPEGRGLGLAVLDLDGDGRLDIYVANDASDDFFFRNLGGLKFVEMAQSAGLATDGEGRATASMGTVAEDLDGDGLPDLIHTNLLNESSTLHRNLGGGLFRDATLDAGLRAPSKARTGFGIAPLDADRDGLLDLFVANGHVDDQPWLNSPMAQSPQFFYGMNGGRFVLSGAGGSPYLSRRVVGRGLAAGDLDNDGAVDVVVVHRDGPAVVLRNETPGGRWLGLSWAGDPVGARVVARVGGRELVRHRAAGTGYLGPGDPRMVLGLGSSDALESLEVAWPSGRRERLEVPGLDRYLVIEEGKPPREAGGAGGR